MASKRGEENEQSLLNVERDRDGAKNMTGLAPVIS